jgi:MFS transporter, ACS family, glucarate transporter
MSGRMNGTPLPAAGPTRVRYGVLAFACSLAAITYLDRLSIGSAAEKDYLPAALGLAGSADLRWAFTAFSLAYAIFEVPTGWLGDVFGPRTTLIRIVLWWSFFTAVTALAGVQVADLTVVGLTALVVIRFLFGIGEAGAFPNITRALHNWFPVTERGMAQGFVWMSGRLMGGLTPLIWAAVVVWGGVSWRWAFVIFGCVGLVWCVAFATWFRNRPEEHPAVSREEVALIRAGTDGATEQAHARVPWGQLLRSGNLWAICVMYFLMSYPWYFNVNYLPAYLQEMHDVKKDSPLGSLYKGGPLIFGAVGCLVGGWLTDRYTRRTGNRRWSRRVFGMVGHGACVPLYLYCVTSPGPTAFAVAFALTGFFNDLAMGSAWATCQDIGRRHAAIVAGCMNTIGNLGGAASSWVIGELLLRSRAGYLAGRGLESTAFAGLGGTDQAAALLPGYEWNFYSFAAMYAVAVALWLCIDATKPVFREDAA